jgi:predicted XRE-type DNA-binding protein
MTKRVKFVRGSDNVFADIGLPNPEEHLLKAELVGRLIDIIKARKLTQTSAARLLGIGQPDLSKILRGHFHDVSVERLLRFLAGLDQKVEIVVTPLPKGLKPMKVTVRAA